MILRPGRPAAAACGSGRSSSAALLPRARRAVAGAARRRRCLPASAGREVRQAAPAPPAGAAGSGNGGGGAPAEQPAAPRIDCVATGMDVECVVPDGAAPARGADAAAGQAAPLLALSDDAAGPGQHIECVETGMGASCFVADDDPGGGADGASAAPRPATAAAAAAGGDGPLAQLLGVALLVSPFFFWGTSMVAMKPVTAHTTPLLLGAMRLLPAGAALVAWAAATGRPQPKTAEAWLWILAFGLVDGAAFQGFLAEGLQRTSAGLGSVIIDSQPLSVALLAALLFGEALSGVGVAGLFIGVAGLLLLEVPPDALAGAAALLGGGAPEGAALLAAPAAPAAAAAAAGGGAGGWSLLDSGEFWMLLAAQSMAVGTVMVRWVTKHADPVMATAWHMVLGGALLGAAALASDAAAGGGELASRLALFDGRDAAAMAYVSLLGGAASYGIFFYEATHGSLTAISSLTFLTPMFAAGAGFLALGETLTPLQLAGAGVTLAAVFMINSPASHAPPGGGGGGEPRGGGGGEPS
ncbi:WAT1-related protein [Scenedesmus sp. PABB004]|nr:WAT1-related protein [Scenedesmus sp. PABB004]